MEMERLDFQEAVKLLAERAHLPLPAASKESVSLRPDERERIYAANVTAARFFHATLWTDEGAQGLSLPVQTRPYGRGHPPFWLGFRAARLGRHIALPDWGKL